MKLPVDYNSLNWKEVREVREEYIKRQGGKCCHCGAPLSGPPNTFKGVNKKLFPPKFFNYPVHLHHDHSTGMTIGAVHAKCNATLWQYHKE
jgi:hypothetical protein